MLRKLLIVLAIVASQAANAQFSKSTLTSQVTSQLPDNSVGAITPSVMRTLLTNFINSWQQYEAVNAQVGTTYTIQASDYGQLITFNNGGSVAVTIPQANGSFLYFSTFIKNVGAGTVTITPATGTIDGSASLAIVSGGYTVLVSDQTGTNYVTASGIPSSLACGLFPALTGDVTTSAHSCATTISAGVVSNSKLATMNNLTVKGNISGSSANPIDLTGGQVGSMLCIPIRTVIISGTNTYTTPSCNSVTATWLETDVQGGGGGGGSSGTTGSNNNGSAGNNTTFGTLTASGGGAGGGGNNAPGAGGACSGSLGTQQNFPGSSGSGPTGTTGTLAPGGIGGVSFYGGYGASVNDAAGGAPPANSGGGGAGAGSDTTANVVGGAGGGAGCHIRTIITSPNATYSYGIGATANGGSAGTSGFVGGAGAAGLIDIIAHWQ